MQFVQACFPGCKPSHLIFLRRQTYRDVRGLLNVSEALYGSGPQPGQALVGICTHVACSLHSSALALSIAIISILFWLAFWRHVARRRYQIARLCVALLLLLLSLLI